MAFADRRLAAGQQRIRVLIVLRIFRPAGDKRLDITGVIGVQLPLNHIFRTNRFTVHNILQARLKGRNTAARIRIGDGNQALLHLDDKGAGIQS
ncbi:hypothetical protein [Serratia entomophila]|uniref:hypothetical protein n=1 Tax=Serratia entomophila TaxID=42906 RepID=UPI0021BAA309|nr:hypothetical protein [Serratia entomophila]